MRITALFDWPDDKGQLWRDILRKSARQEFEAARYERDPEIVRFSFHNKLLFFIYIKTIIILLIARIIIIITLSPPPPK